MITFLLFFLLSSFSFAKDLPCKTLADLDKITSECSDNHHYLRAARSCLRVLENRLQKETPFPLTELATKVQTLDTGKRKKLKSLVTTTLTQVTIYRNNIFYPEHWDDPEEVIGDPVQYMNSHNCYNQANQEIKQVQNKIKAYARFFESQKKKNK